jgi:hypothetical protein
VATRQTFTLQEVADAYLPPEWTDGPRWLSRKLNRGQLKGIKAGRTWMLRQCDIDFMLDTLANQVAQPEPVPDTADSTVMSFSEALSPRSRAQLRKVDK